MPSVELEDLIAHMRSLAPIKDALGRLHTELPANLLYHTAEHTEDVMSEVLYFGLHDSLCYHDLFLLAAAAAFHDIGFISRASQNEELCALMAVERLSSEATFSTEDVATIKQMILDTALQTTDKGLKQIPRIPLSRYLLDADVSNLGRTDFLTKVELLRRESNSAEGPEFFQRALQFFDAHEWYTDAAKSLRQQQKEKNRAQLIETFPASIA